MVGGELEDAVAEPDVFGALAGGSEKGFRRRRMRIFFQEMMFYHPGIIVAQPVGGLQLRQRILIKLELIARLPRARQLQLVKDAEFHDVSPRGPFCLFWAVYSQGNPSPARTNSARWKAGLRRAHEWVVLRV
jgi:hypothetical protein